MPTFKLDDREIPFEPGQTIIEAARGAGIDIPHYCWHPGLSVAANCRMCLVEVGPPPGRKPMMLDVLREDPKTGEFVQAQKPKLQPACQMRVADGMDVKSESSHFVQEARSSVQEMLLLNHPVDCPICDQAGECRLQDYWLQHQATEKRMKDEPIHKPKAVVFGPNIVYDAERCIVCTRCVRFCEEVAKDPVLDIRERGNLNEVVVSPGRQLDNAYTLMTEYVCPVGALTATDFRFKARVWFLRSVRTVCQGCATGCNSFLDYDPRDSKVHRQRPRENLEVNQYWMCDEGVLDYRRIHENRIFDARVDGEDVPVDVALDKIAGLIKPIPGSRVALLLSAEHSVEDNYALLRLGAAVGSTGRFLSGRPSGEADDVLRHADKNPNRQGVLDLCLNPSGGVKPGDFAALGVAIAGGKFDYVLALGSQIESNDGLSALSTFQGLIDFGAHEGPLTRYARVGLPAATSAEGSGTFVNAKGIAQSSERAIRPLGAARPAWKLLSLLSERLGNPLGWEKLADLRRSLEGGDAKASSEAALSKGATP